MKLHIDTADDSVVLLDNSGNTVIPEICSREPNDFVSRSKAKAAEVVSAALMLK